MTKPRNPWLVLVLLAMAQFIVVLDTSIVNVALPAIQKALNFSPASLQWVVTAYTLAVGGFLLLGGRAADLYGRRKMFLAGLAVFTAASLVDGLAQSSSVLVVARALQGLAGAFMTPAALSILLVTFKEGAERNKAMAIWGAVASGGAAAGVLLGGILTQYLNWRWNFFINVPVGAAIFAAAWRMLPVHESEARDNSLDLPGAASITLSMILLVFGLTEAPEAGWLAGSTIAYLGVSVFLMAFFIWNELRAKHPLVDFKIFRIRNVTGANIMQVMISASMFSVFFFTSLYIQMLLGYSPVETGLSYLAIPFTIAIAATQAPKVIGKFGYKHVLTIAPLFVAAGLVLMAQLPLDGNYWTDILPAFVLLGFGMGFTFVGGTIAATSGVPASQSGLASGLLNTAQQIGGSLGLAILSGIAASATANSLSPESVLEGYHAAFYAATGFAIAASLIALFVLRHVKGADPVEVPVSAGH